ncbi:MAG: hypothetical protein AAFU64_01685 [Bacteroidota bacterium]
MILPPRIGILLSLLLLLLPACLSDRTWQILAGTDTIEILYYKKGKPGEFSGESFSIRDKQFIREFFKSLSDKAPTQVKDNCEPIGRMRFLKARIDLLLYEADFILEEGCAALLLEYEGEVLPREIFPEGVEFLKLARKYKEAIDNEDIL